MLKVGQKSQLGCQKKKKIELTYNLVEIELTCNPIEKSPFIQIFPDKLS